MDKIEIQLVCIANHRELVLSAHVVSGTTIAEAITQLDIAKEMPGVNVASAKKGVFGVVRPDDWVLVDGDRVEIYQPLHFDPREARRRRAKTQRTRATPQAPSPLRPHFRLV